MTLRFPVTLASMMLLAASLLHPAMAEQKEVADPLTLDEEYALIAKEVPGFGGLYYDAAGEPNVYLKDLSQAPAFQLAEGGPVKFHQGRYDYLELISYRDKLLDVLSRPDVVLLDIDEGKNIVRVGLDDKAPLNALDGLESAILGAGVPREAVVVDRVPAIQFLATVRDRVRPVPGGVQIAFGGFLCTQGFNADRGGVRGYVTNSHCTNIQGGVEGTVHYQNTNSSSNRIGVEQVDPTYFTGGACPAGRRCRYSDSSWGRYDTASTAQFARIARTTAPGSLTISSTSRFTITGTVANPTLGQTLNKVGRTTGWSRGTVNTTCATINVSETTLTLLCHSLVGARVGSGDSGSPVFSAGTSTTNVNATLYGILWGGDAAGTTFAFSPWSGITRAGELGGLTVR